MSELVAESVVRMEDGSLWAVTVQTTDEDENLFEIESQVRQPDSTRWDSVDVQGPYDDYEEAMDAAECMYPEHSLTLV